MSKKGWIRLDRQIEDHWIWSDKPFSKGQAWIDLILLAKHKDQKFYHNGKIIEGKKGTVYTSISSLAERWGWDRKKVTRFLKLLESDEMVTTDGATHGTTVTLVKYGYFQNCGTTDWTIDGTTIPQQLPNNSPTTPQPFPTYKNYNNDNNVNNDNKDDDDDMAPQPTTGQYEDIVQRWNSIPHTRNIDGIYPMTQRDNEIRFLISQYGYDGVYRAMDKIRDSGYLKRIGDVRFDSYMNSNVIQKVLEGNYDNDYQGVVIQGGWKDDGYNFGL